MIYLDYQKLHERILDNTIEAIVVTDDRGHILQVNRAFTQITGYTAEEALGKTPALLRSGRHPDNFYAAMWKQIKSEGHWTGEVWNRRKTGEIYLQWLSINAIVDAASQQTHYVAISHDLSELRAREAEIEFLAFHDPLTRLGNRQALFNQLEHALARSRRNQQPLGLMILDVGRLRPINDHFGMKAGDEVIQAQAERLHLLVSSSNTLVRLQGDTFAVLCHSQNSEYEMIRLARRILKTLGQTITYQNETLVMRPSVGIALFPQDAQDRDELLQAAEHAHQAAKQAGRRTFCFFDPKQHHAQQRNLQIEQALASLVEQGEAQQMQLYFQPKVDLQSSNICGVEALLRWPHPEMGWISPAEFIPVAEQNNLAVRLDRWVVRQACRHIRDWLAKGLKVPRVAINLSVHQLDQEDFVEWLVTAVRDNGLTPDRLQLEITESVMIRNSDEAASLLSELQQQGFSISLDDFGTGYSSLACLSDLPLNELKIDRSFLLKINQDARSLKLLESIVSMAHNLELEVVIEGIEEADQLEFLSNMGAIKVQGFYFYKPMPDEALAELLANL